MSDRVCVLAVRVLLALIVSGACLGTAVGQGQRKEAEAKKVVRNADPALFTVVAPGTSFTYRISLKKGFRFDAGHSDGIVVTNTRGNVVVGAGRRVSGTLFELDFSSADTGVGGSATLQINVTNSKGRLRFVRGAVTIALGGGNELVTIDTIDKTILSRIDVGARPIGIDVAGLGQQGFTSAFVCNNASASVTVVDLATNTILGTVPVDSLPSYVAVAGIFNFQTAYVTNSGSGTVTAIDVETLGVVGTIVVGAGPRGIATAGQPGLNEVLYVANHDDDTVSVINAQTNAVVQTIAVGDGPTGVAVNGPVGVQVVAVTNENDNTVTLINANSNTVTKTVPVGSRPVAAAAGGAALNIFYVANQGAGSVSVIDTRTQAETARIAVGSQPNGVTVAGPSAIEEIYVSNGGDGTVSVIDSVRRRTVFTVPIGGRPRAVATYGPINLARVLVTN